MRGEEGERAREERRKSPWGGKSSILDTVCVSGEPGAERTLPGESNVRYSGALQYTQSTVCSQQLACYR